MKIHLILLCLLLFITGCQAQGHRKFEIEIFGNTIRVEDETMNNSDGEDKYYSGFDDDSSFTKWLFPISTDKDDD